MYFQAGDSVIVKTVGGGMKGTVTIGDNANASQARLLYNFDWRNREKPVSDNVYEVRLENGYLLQHVASFELDPTKETQDKWDAYEAKDALQQSRQKDCQQNYHEDSLGTVYPKEFDAYVGAQRCSWCGMESWNMSERPKKDKEAGIPVIQQRSWFDRLLDKIEF